MQDIQVIRKRIRSCAKRVVLVMSGKGGVGKSTVTSLLARSMAAPLPEPLNVGVIDLDLCGPSMPRLFGIEDEPVHQTDSGWSPVMVNDNLAIMSSGLIMPSKESALIWRGPKKNALIKQMFRDIDWTDESSSDQQQRKRLDFLLIDTPPGTSDEHLSAVNLLGMKHDKSNEDGVIDGAILVTTPSEISLIDVRRQVNFCRRTSLPILGLVENMASMVCGHCAGLNELYQKDDQDMRPVDRLARDFQCGPVLCSIPLDLHVATCLDAGQCPLGCDEESNGENDEQSKVGPQVRLSHMLQDVVQLLLARIDSQ